MSKQYATKVLWIGNFNSLFVMVMGAILVSSLASRYPAHEFMIAFFGILIVAIYGCYSAYRFGNKARRV